jgi:electron transport complex protein RnfE
VGTLRSAALQHNPAWGQLLGLCPLLAVSNSIVNALGMAAASSFVMLGSSATISTIRTWIPHDVRLPCFMLVIATFTTCAVMLLEAFAFDLYLRIALFVQIIVSNCMILGRIEVFASRQPLGQALLDALGTAMGFALALLALGSIREALGHGTLLAGMDLLFGAWASSWQIDLLPEGKRLIVALVPPGAFIIAGLLLGTGQALARSDKTDHESPETGPDLREVEG